MQTTFIHTGAGAVKCACGRIYATFKGNAARAYQAAERCPHKQEYAD